MKPIQILDLEKLLGIEMREVSTPEEVMHWDGYNTFLLDERGEVIGLNLNVNEIQDILFLENWKYLKYLSFIGNNIVDISRLSNLTNLQELNFGANQVSDILILSHLNTLQVLKFTQNPIQDISPISNLSNLQELDFSMTFVQDISSLWHLTNLQTLNFSYNQVQDISPLSNLTNLQKLDFGGNQVQDISPLRHLGNLQKLNFSYNQVQDISHLRHLSNLQKLDFKENQVQDISHLRHLSNLEKLDFSYNQVQDISPLRHLSNLQKLDFWINRIQDISHLRHLTNLQTLNFNCNQVQDISHLRHLSNLQKLDFSYNQIQNISHLRHLSNLQKLDFKENQVQDISHLRHLSNLQKLDFSYNQVQDISSLKHLTNSQKLSFEYNQVQDISLSFLQSFPQLEELYIKDNPLPKIPKEITNKDNCLPELLSYLQDLEKGKPTPNNEVKIVLIGNGSVGKTQIAKRLAEQEAYKFVESHDSTHAITLLQRTLSCENLPCDLALNIWDFGGQDIYHATHRLFMQTQALFLLVWDTENEANEAHIWQGASYKNEKMEYWLKYAQYFSPESPILVIQNKCDTEAIAYQYALAQPAQQAIKDKYPAIVEMIQLSAKTAYSFELLEYVLEETFEKNEKLWKDLIDKPLPLSWVHIRDRIRAEQAKPDGLKTLDTDTFLQWCKAEELIVDAAQTANTLLYFFHQTGVFYYQEKYFSNQIILDRLWAIEAVYKVLDKGQPYYQLLKQKKGKLTYKEIQRIWKQHTDEERELFLGFMLSCELCFETTEKGKYGLSERSFVVPQLLGEQKPAYLSDYSTTRGLSFSEKIEYAFLPPSLIQRFIIKAHHFAEVADMWQSGILLQYQDAAALVSASYGISATIEIQYNSAAKGILLPAIYEELRALEKDEKESKKIEYHQGGFDAKKFGFERLQQQPFSKENLIQEIEKYLYKGDIAKVIDLLRNYAAKYDNELNNSVLQTSMRFYENKANMEKGVVSDAEYKLEMNRVTEALIGLKDSI